MYSSLAKQPGNQQVVCIGIVKALHAQEVIQLHSIAGGHIVSIVFCPASAPLIALRDTIAIILS
jgi:hypothetical protein